MQGSAAVTERAEIEEFLSTFHARQIEAETALHNGDAEPRLALWSTRDPVSLFGAWGPSKTGTEEVTQISRWVASRFSDCSEYEVELVAAGVSDDMAYTVCYEHSVLSVDGGPPRRHTLRATHIYRREDGEWKIVHRHGDVPPVDESPPRPE